MDLGARERTLVLSPLSGGVSGGSEYDSSPPLWTPVGRQPGWGRSVSAFRLPSLLRCSSEMYSITVLQTQHTASPRHPVSLGSSPLPALL